MGGDTRHVKKVCRLSELESRPVTTIGGVKELTQIREELRQLVFSHRQGGLRGGMDSARVIDSGSTVSDEAQFPAPNLSEQPLPLVEQQMVHARNWASENGLPLAPFEEWDQQGTANSQSYLKLGEEDNDRVRKHMLRKIFQT